MERQDALGSRLRSLNGNDGDIDWNKQGVWRYGPPRRQYLRLRVETMDGNIKVDLAPFWGRQWRPHGVWTETGISPPLVGKMSVYAEELWGFVPEATREVHAPMCLERVPCQQSGSSASCASQTSGDSVAPLVLG